VTSCIVDSAAIYIMVVKFAPPPLHRSSPFIGGLRCQAIQMEHGPYIAEITQKVVYIVRCLWLAPSVADPDQNLFIRPGSIEDISIHTFFT
jgi:hypothetical protein